MSSGNRNDEKVLLYQIGDVLQLVQEGKRTIKDVSRAQAALINDDEIHIRPKLDNRIRLRSNYESLDEALQAAECRLLWDPNQVFDPREHRCPEPIIIQPVNCWVTPVCFRTKTSVREAFEKYPNMVDPVRLLTYLATPQGREFARTELIGTQWRYGHKIWTATVCLTNIGYVFGLTARMESSMSDWSRAHYILVNAN